MSLSRQLILLVSMLVTVLFLGTFTISMVNTRHYLESQLASHAQDAATSLGLSASAHAEGRDRAMVATMVNAMFHRGDYRAIRFEDLDGEVWIERKAALDVSGVPGWFVRAVTLRAPERSATMMSGWRQVGRVFVTSHPGLAYAKLWRIAQETLLLFLLSALVVLLLGLLVLRILLRPLAAVEAQAQAICNREFPVVDHRPFTLEFRRVSEAMNRLSARVSRMLGESEQVAAQLRQQAFQDALTGLANRRQFMDVLEHRIAERELLGSGGLLLIALREFTAFNQREGYAAGDRLLVDAAARIEACLAQRPRTTLAHLSGADFAVLLDTVDADGLGRIAAAIAAALAGLHGRHAVTSADVGHIGGALYAGQTASGFLAEADLALREAQRVGANAWVVHAQPEAARPPRPRSAWRELLVQAIGQREFRLLRQPVVAGDGRRLLHHEVFVRVADPDDPEQAMPGAVLVPMAEAVGLASELDRAVVEAVAADMADGVFPGRVAVNLSPHSLRDTAFTGWLVGRLRGDPALAHRLVLELPEYGVSSDTAPLVALIDALAPLGVGFSLDHFGKGFASFAYLRAVKVDILKIDGSFVRRLDAEDGNRFFISTLVGIAHGLEMQVVAEAVESDDVWQILLGLGVDGGRGFLFGRPDARPLT